MKNYINIMEKDRELCLSNNLEEIEKKFEPCTECEECYFLWEITSSLCI